MSKIWKKLIVPPIVYMQSRASITAALRYFPFRTDDTVPIAIGTIAIGNTDLTVPITIGNTDFYSIDESPNILQTMPPIPSVETWRAASLRYATFYNAAGGDAKVAPFVACLVFLFFNGRILGGIGWVFYSSILLPYSLRGSHTPSFLI